MTLDEFSLRVRALEKSLYKTAICIVKNDHDAADCVQEALLSAWKNLKSLKNEAYFETWLTRIMINQCKILIRSEKKQKSEALSDIMPAPDRHETGIEYALRQLDEKYRLPIVLHYINGFDVSEIAAILRQPSGTVKTHLLRGRSALRKLLESEVEL